LHSWVVGSFLTLLVSATNYYGSALGFLKRIETMKYLINVLILAVLITSPGCAIPTELEETAPIKIAVLQGEGVGPSANDVVTALEESTEPKFHITRITVDDIRGGKLSALDVLVHPGGSGGKQGRALEEEGREAVRQFVREGGGVLGVCAGAYLATNDYSWSLNLIDAKVVDRKHWARGTGMVKIKLSPAGSEFFNHDGDEMSIDYGQGPLLARREWDDPDVPDYESLAIYASEIAKKGAPQGIMIGNSAIVRAEYGNGRVFAISPHPEKTDGLHYMIPLAASWLAARQ
jgi:hypothetical protein